MQSVFLPKELFGFYDRLKKLHVSFAELPDLQLGDGYTQIAYNPTDAESIKTVVKYYRKILSELTVYLKNGDSSEVIVFDGTEKKAGEFRQSNQTIAANCLKHQENTRKPSGVQEVIREDMRERSPSADTS